ncbi:poly-gamma-glutamate hydrolase family protein [Mesorhizobium sp.]|uniref:poly-gamma-glutamate hydrolase family protein n=1 Tax=Mesorhizobium sp. TaxID=1871066 RepID=UPI0011FF8F05|nr:poly-gamma-glutamate hydrolase family protein [Mesorhizobium sp.]TIL66629.1 MAG: replication protein [Mesorhizobium sp.]
MARKDKYGSYEELSQKERENVDYSVTARHVPGSKIAIAAPHGGGIEFHTAELAESIAGDDHNFYAFRGLKETGNRALHITSHRFNEERALTLIEPCERVITLHGVAGDALSLQIGGRDAELRSRVHEALRDAGFDSKVVAEGEYAGMKRQNICNRGSTHAGVQLEIYAGLRQALKDDDDAYARFINALRSAL